MKITIIIIMYKKLLYIIYNCFCFCYKVLAVAVLEFRAANLFAATSLSEAEVYIHIIIYNYTP